MKIFTIMCLDVFLEGLLPPFGNAMNPDEKQEDSENIVCILTLLLALVFELNPSFV